MAHKWSWIRLIKGCHNPVFIYRWHNTIHQAIGIYMKVYNQDSAVGIYMKVYNQDSTLEGEPWFITIVDIMWNISLTLKELQVMCSSCTQFSNSILIG